MKDQSDSDQALREGNKVIALRGGPVPTRVSISDGHLALRRALTLPTHLGGRGCRAIEFNPY